MTDIPILLVNWSLVPSSLSVVLSVSTTGYDAGKYMTCNTEKYNNVRYESRDLPYRLNRRLSYSESRQY